MTQKMPKRTKRYIMVKHMDDAENIKQWCINNCEIGELGYAWNSINICFDRCVFGERIAVCFYCSLDIWKTIYEYFDLTKDSEYSHHFHMYRVR